jgi:hypothetical protein
VSLEVSLGSTPVSLAPGVATRVPVELHNRSPVPVAVRMSMARGRVAGWAYVEPADVTVDGGGTAAVEVVLEAPAGQPPTTSLMPFTVHAVETATGAPAGFATGLLSVAVPVPVVGDLVARGDAAHVFDLHLANRSEAPAPVRIAAELDPPVGGVAVEPGTVRLEPRGSVTAVVRARPRRPLLGTPRPYVVAVAVTDANDPDRPALLTVTGTGTRRPRITNRMAGVAAIVTALAATAAVALSGVRLPLPGRTRATPPGSAAPAPAVVTVGRPYALIDVFPQRGDDGGWVAAEAARSRLAGAGMPVKLVDSLTSDVLADGGGGFWVLLQDGFATADAAQAFCARWKVVAPKCAVTA